MAVINKGYSKSNGTSNYSKYYGNTKSNKYTKTSTLKTLPKIGPSTSIGNTNLFTKTFNNNKISKKNYSTYDVGKKNYSTYNVGKKEGPIYGPYSTLPKSKSSSNSNKSSSSGGSYSGGGGGASAPVADNYAIDLTDILNTYTASAEAQKQSIMGVTSAQQKFYEDALKAAIEELKLSEKSQRETLSKSLERFQQDTAESRKQQQANFTANRADLEAQAYLANRQALQSAASRGLGGSGLQQLAQLQNLINQSAATNELATENTQALNALAEALARQEQDTTQALTDLASGTTQKINSMSTENQNKINTLLSEQKGKLAEIDANTASTKAQLQYNENVRAQEARTQAEQFAAQMRAQNASLAQSWRMHQEEMAANEKAEADALNEYNNMVNTNLSNIIQAAEDSMNIAGSQKGSKNKLKDTKEAYYYARDEIRKFTNNNNIDSALKSSYEKQLSTLLKTYQNKYKK